MRICLEKLAKAAPSPTIGEAAKHVQQLNSAIEEIFLFTLNKYSVVAGDQANLVFLSSLAEVIGTSLFVDWTLIRILGVIYNLVR